jgi:UDPglucose 6-dehydrogenase
LRPIPADKPAPNHCRGRTLASPAPAVDNARRLFPTLDYTSDIEKAVEGADLVLHLTEWQYRDLDPAELLEHVNTPRVIDTRNTLDIDLWRAAGWSIRALGRPAR